MIAKKHRYIKFIIAAFCSLFIGGLAMLGSASALSGSEFQAGRIIDDSVFFNPNTMSVNDIQYFLNVKMPNCDTNGSKIYSGSTTRAQHGTSQGYPPPYTCLKDYSENTPTKYAENQLCNYLPAGHRTAAQMIYDAAQICGINPQVLLVLLQKEQSLVTDDWPWSIQYRSATGFGCPDTAPCDAEYYGFFNQIYHAARIYKKYVRDAQSFNHRAYRNNNVLYSPISSCGSSNVYIHTQATAGLYNYTPYQPNPAALANLYGTGDSCSAYGNRNFWRMFNDWFGSTHTSTPYAWSPVSQEMYADAGMTRRFSSSTVNIAPGQKAYLKITARNIGYKIWDQSIVHFGTSRPDDSSSPFSDASWLTPKRLKMNETSVAPGETATFTFSITANTSPGLYYQYFSLVADGITWMNNPGLFFAVNVTPQQQPSNTQDTSLEPGESLTPGKYLLSPDSYTVLRLQNEGDLTLFSNFKPTWTNNMRGQNMQGVYMQPDGNLVAYARNGSPLWASGTSGNPGAHLVLQTDGNAVIYSTNGTALWSSGTAGTPNYLSQVVYTMQNDTLYPGQSLLTPDHKYRMVLQRDGNLVIYGNGKALWASSTAGRDSAQLSMQPDGNLVIYNKNGSAIWTSGTSGNGVAVLSMQPDGNLVIYNPNGRAAWASNTRQ